MAKERTVRWSVGLDNNVPSGATRCRALVPQPLARPNLLTRGKMATNDCQDVVMKILICLDTGRNET